MYVSLGTQHEILNSNHMQIESELSFLCIDATLSIYSITLDELRDRMENGLICLESIVNEAVVTTVVDVLSEPSVTWDKQKPCKVSSYYYTMCIRYHSNYG